MSVITGRLGDPESPEQDLKQCEAQEELEEEYGPTGLIDFDVETVMRNAHLSRKEAQDALYQSNGDMVG